MTTKIWIVDFSTESLYFFIVADSIATENMHKHAIPSFLVHLCKFLYF